jgi:hypothetical protein
VLCKDLSGPLSTGVEHGSDFALDEVLGLLREVVRFVSVSDESDLE